MKISLVTPAGKQSKSGNRTTAVRWAGFLREFGHRVEISETDEDGNADMMIAVHAWRSANSIRAFSDRFPNRPLAVLLAGTDIYEFQFSHTEVTLGSMDRANRLICLHELAKRAIPARFAPKLSVIHQSAPQLTMPRTPSTRWFEVFVAGHLREVKDPLLTACAARLVPDRSRLRIVHFGKAHDDLWAAKATEETRNNRRYVWRGEVLSWQVRRQFARSHAMVISSVAEGGANVVSESIVCGVPVIASHIDGNVGLLGEDYSGYFPAKDEKALARLLYRSETDTDFLNKLTSQCARRRPLFSQERERAVLRTLIEELTT